MASVNLHQRVICPEGSFSDISLLHGYKASIPAHPASSPTICSPFSRYTGYFVSHWNPKCLTLAAVSQTQSVEILPITPFILHVEAELEWATLSCSTDWSFFAYNNVCLVPLILNEVRNGKVTRLSTVGVSVGNDEWLLEINSCPGWYCILCW